MPLAKKFKKSSYRYRRRKNYYRKSNGKNYRRKNKYTGILTGFGDYYPVYRKKKANSFFSTLKSGVSFVVNTLFNAAKYLTPLALTAIAVAHAPGLGRYAASLGFTGLTDFINAVHENKYLQHMLPDTVKGWLRSFSEGVQAETYDIADKPSASQIGRPMDISAPYVPERDVFELMEEQEARQNPMVVSEPYNQLHDLEQQAALRRKEKAEEEKSLVPVPFDVERFGSVDPSSYQSVNPMLGYVPRRTGPSKPRLHKFSPIKYEEGGPIVGGVRSRPRWRLAPRGGPQRKKQRVIKSSHVEPMDVSRYNVMSKKYYF